MRISLGYPSFTEELSVIERQEQTHPIDQLEAVANPEDVISLQAAARNIYVDGAVRDVDKMAEMGFAVFARGTCIYDSQDRQHVTAIDVPVEIDGVRFSAGDLVVADRDGVVVVPSEIQEQAIRAAWEKVHAENVTRDAIQKGMKATDAYRTYGVL